MKIFQRVQEIWSGQESVTEGQMNGQTKAISIIPHPLLGGGLKISILRTLLTVREALCRRVDTGWLSLVCVRARHA